MSNNNYLLTFHMTWSYGACLQAFATLEALKNVGCKAEILNFINPHERKGNETPFQLIKDGDFKAGLIAAAKNIIFQRAKLHARAFEKFHSRLPRTERVYTSCAQMADIEADALIVGSDQVWNPFITGGIEPAFFLQFGKATRRLSLASSLGSHTYNEIEQQEIREYLTKFDAISVREAHAVEQIAPLTEKPVFRCLDPTLLLDREYWRAFSKKPEGFKGNERYILVFNLASRTDKEMELWKRFSIDSGLPLWRLSNNTFKDKVFDRLLLGMTPEEFVWLIDHAQYVITDSFHGTAFSVNMGKPFVAMEPIRGNRARIVDLLNLVGMDNRMLAESACELPSIDLDYSYAESALCEERSRCMAWIKGALND